MTPTSTQVPSASPAFNPSMPHELKLSKDAEEWLKSVNPGFQTDEQIQAFWNASPTQLGLTLVNDGDFRGAIQQIKDSHQWTQFFAYEFVLLVVLWFFRPWKLAKATTWMRRIWTQLWTGWVFWILAIFLIPSLVWGDAYRTLLSHLVKGVFRHFFA